MIKLSHQFSTITGARDLNTRRESLYIRASKIFMVCVMIIVSVYFARSVTAADSTLNVSDNTARQSLLFRIDSDGLHLTRRDLLDNQPGAAQSSLSALDQSIGKSAIRLDSGRSLQQSSDLAPSDLQTAVPHAEWLDSDGMTLAVTQFAEPRIARVPQQGQLIHEAVLGQATAYFLIRGPAAAVRVNVFLPDLGIADSLGLQNSGAANRAGRTASKADSRTTEALRQNVQQSPELKDVLQKQNWQIELAQ